jgi:hypothetical protein
LLLLFRRHNMVLNIAVQKRTQGVNNHKMPDGVKEMVLFKIRAAPGIDVRNECQQKAEARE